MTNTDKATPRPWTYIVGKTLIHIEQENTPEKSASNPILPVCSIAKAKEHDASLIVKCVNGWDKLKAQHIVDCQDIEIMKQVVEDDKRKNEALLEALKNYTLCGTAREVKPMRECLEDALKAIAKAEAK